MAGVNPGIIPAILLANQEVLSDVTPVMTLRFVLSAMVLGGLLASAVAADKLEKRKSPKGAKAYIITPKDGKSVNKKFTV
ncbi:uncharacterized protein METZ01_LOCUS317261, partial [marine metagenome]